MKKDLRILSLLLIFFISMVAKGQNVEITGKVVNTNGETIPGVNVVIKSTTIGTITNIDGQYRLATEVDGTTILVFSFIGFDTQEVEIKNSQVIDIIMKEDSEVLEDVVVVGYGSQSKKSVVGAIAQVGGDELKSIGTVTNVADALSGTMPGVNIMTSTGLPGFRDSETLNDKPGYGGESEILIRGMSTWNNAGPLILVDGVEREMNDLDVNTIETVSVLKDASATAVYGVKGANGVILITTKQGKVGKAKVNVEANFTYKKVSRIDKAVSSYEGLRARNYAIMNDLPVVGETDFSGLYMPSRLLGYYRDGVDPEKYPNVDWQDTMLSDYAKSSSYNLNVSGGTAFVKYFTSVAYTHDGDIFDTGSVNDRGYSPAFNYDRFNFRTNLDFSLSPSTNFRLNLSGFHGIQKTPGNSIFGLFNGIYKYNPASYLPQYSDGVYGLPMVPGGNTSQDNSWWLLNTGGVNTTNKTGITTDFQLTQELDVITKGLSVSGKFSFDNTFYSWGRNITDDNNESDKTVRKGFDVNTGEWIWDIPITTNGFDFVQPPLEYSDEIINAGAAKKTSRNIYYEFAVNYKRRFNKHTFSGLALFSRQETNKGSNWPTKREDWVGRLTYDYNSKYLVEVNGAYNGSQRFGPDYKFDFFPSVALGWRISEEAFVKDISFISNLKLRYSMGLIGDDRVVGVGNWPYLTVWDNGGDQAYFGNGKVGTKTLYPTAAEGTPGNYDIHWEESQKQNFGLEYGFFNELISGTVDYYTEHRTNMLIGGSQRQVPDYFGTTPPAANIGIVDSHGLEFLINVRKQFNKVELWASYNWTYNYNEIQEKDESAGLPAYQKEAGFPINQTRGKISSGLISSWDQMYTGVLNENIATKKQTLPGDGRGLDFNGDGYINSLDAVAYGYTVYPRNTYGFSFGGSFKGFQLDLRFLGAYNTTMPTESFLNPFEANTPRVMQEILDATQTPEYGNSNPSFPTLKMPTRKPDTYEEYSRDGSYLRLKTAQLTYTIPQKLVSKLKMSRCQVYVNGNNLWLWNKLPFDKEGYGGNKIYNQYPNVKQINFGTKISF